MIGTTLIEIREHIETLASADGEFYLVCGRTGDQPIPAAGKRFEGRTTARNAARATEQYRTALRRYDPQLPCYDVIVCQDTEICASSGWTANQSQDVDDDWALSDPVVTKSTPRLPSRELVEFCHRVAAAVFETLSDGGYDAVETAVMDTYFHLAETVSDPNTLCLYLLESMATELDSRLTPAEQADVLAHASTRLTPTESNENPISATFRSLQERGLLGSYTRSPSTIDLDGKSRTVVVQISDYVLSPRQERLPVLPIVLELYRRESSWLPSSLQAVDVDEGWRVTLVLAKEAEPDDLVSAPIQSDV